MLKVFLSFPMKGRTNEQIAYSISQLSLLARVLYGDDIEIVDNFCDVEPVEGADIHMLRIAEAIRKLAYCDVILYPNNYECYRGCKAEVNIWQNYKGRSHFNQVAYNVGYIKDAEEIKQAYDTDIYIDTRDIDHEIIKNMGWLYDEGLDNYHIPSLDEYIKRGKK